MQPNAIRIARYADLSHDERRLCAAFQEMGFGHLENVEVRDGKIVLDPWPTQVLTYRLGLAQSVAVTQRGVGAELKEQLIELFTHLRGFKHASVRRLEVRHGLPVSMEVEQEGGIRG